MLSLSAVLRTGRSQSMWASCHKTKLRSTHDGRVGRTGKYFSGSTGIEQLGEWSRCSLLNSVVVENVVLS